MYGTIVYNVIEKYWCKNIIKYEEKLKIELLKKIRLTTQNSSSNFCVLHSTVLPLPQKKCLKLETSVPPSAILAVCFPSLSYPEA